MKKDFSTVLQVVSLKKLIFKLFPASGSILNSELKDRTHSTLNLLKNLIPICLPIFLGITIYWLFRGIPFLNETQVYRLPHNLFTSFLLFSLPDGLWLFALLSAIAAIWRTPCKESHSWLLTIFVGSILSEVAQKFHIIPGTFDWLDILAYSIVAFIFSINYFSKIKTN